MMPHVAEILLVEDNPGDVALIRRALGTAKLTNTLHVVTDGEAALRFLRREAEYAGVPVPDLMLLDLNIPRIDGREVLRRMRADPATSTIPVVVLTSSKAEQDIVETYDLKANCYITKPVDLDQFFSIVRSVENFWLAVVTLPSAARDPAL